MFEESSTRLADYRTRLEALQHALKLEAKRAEIKELEDAMAVEGFWNDPEAAQGIMQRMKHLKSILEAPARLQSEIEDAETLIEMAREETDESMIGEIDTATESVGERLTQLELNSLLNDPRDAKNAIINIHPGAGGTESCDWAEMLYRMIVRFCERRDFTVEVLDYQPGDEAGLKGASLHVSGPMAYGNLKSESGVHRLVRISPYDAQSRRHTSFAAIEVLTEIDDSIEVEVRDEDLKMDVFRSSGAGGQKVNKTSSAVRLTHLPTGIVVACQMERSQHRNRDVAVQMLKAKLYDIEMKKKQEELDQQRDNQRDVAWGSQIRSYVLHPYQMVKDLRTGYETGNVDQTLDGYLDPFIEAYLRWNLERRKN
jgi:peptide chain release factor 2